MKHKWHAPEGPIKWEFCEVCLYLRNDKNADKECKGPTHLSLPGGGKVSEHTHDWFNGVCTKCGTTARARIAELDAEAESWKREAENFDRLYCETMVDRDRLGEILLSAPEPIRRGDDYLLGLTAADYIAWYSTHVAPLKGDGK